MSFSVKHDIRDGWICAMKVDVERPPEPGAAFPLRRFQTWAYVDTGSSGSLIREDVADQLELVPSGVASLTHAVHAGPVDCLTVHLTVVLRGKGRRSHSMPMDLAIAPGTMKPGVILGMDAFRDGVLHIDQRRGWWRFEVPS